MKTQKSLTFLACVSLLLGVHSGWPQQSDSADLVQDIKAGSTEAMLKAGSRGSADLIPLLRTHLKDPDHADYSGSPGNWQPRVAAQLALAKLGDAIEQRKIDCELFYGNPAEQSTAFYKLEYVGGWFEISRLTRFLPDTNENSRQMMPEPEISGGDATIGTRQYLAVSALDRMSLVEPTALSSKEDPFISAPKRARQWQQYIDAHKGELEKLLPTGERAIESDEYCEPYVASLPNRPDSYRVVSVDDATRVVLVEHPGFGVRQGSATFNGHNAPIRQWADNRVTVELPARVAGILTIIKADTKTLTIAVH